ARLPDVQLLHGADAGQAQRAGAVRHRLPAVRHRPPPVTRGQHCNLLGAARLEVGARRRGLGTLRGSRFQAGAAWTLPGRRDSMTNWSLSAQLIRTPSHCLLWLGRAAQQPLDFPPERLPRLSLGLGEVGHAPFAPADERCASVSPNRERWSGKKSAPALSLGPVSGGGRKGRQGAPPPSPQPQTPPWPG